MPATPKAMQSRTMTSAKRSLGLITELAAEHMKTLDNGGVPDAGFMASVQKYEESRVRLDTLARLAAGDDSAAELDGPDEVCVGRDDLGLLVGTLNEFVPGLNTGPDSPLGRILTALGQPDSIGQPGVSVTVTPDRSE